MSSRVAEARHLREEVDIADFEAALDDIDAGDAEGDITVVDGTLAREHRLTVTEV